MCSLWKVGYDKGVRHLREHHVVILMGPEDFEYAATQMGHGIAVGLNWQQIEPCYGFMVRMY